MDVCLPKTLQWVDWLRQIAPGVKECVCVWYPAMDWCPIQGVFQHCSQDRLHIHQATEDERINSLMKFTVCNVPVNGSH